MHSSPIHDRDSELIAARSRPVATLSRRWLATLLVLLGLGIVFVFYRHQILDSLIRGESTLRQFQVDAPILVALVGLLLYTLVAGLTPGAAFLSLAYGWYFGLVQGTVLVSFGSTAGATMMFLLSRHILRDWVQATKNVHIQKVQNTFARDGAYYLFSLRLIPAVPFFLVNILMGLTKIRVSTFWWVSQVGMLPGTVAYIYAGTTLPSLKAIQSGDVGKIFSWQLVFAFALLGLLPWLSKQIVRKLPMFGEP